MLNESIKIPWQTRQDKGAAFLSVHSFTVITQAQCNLILSPQTNPKRTHISLVPQENLLQYSLCQISERLLVKPDGSSKYNKWTKYRITLLWSHGLSSLEKSEIGFSKTQQQNVSFYFMFTITFPPTFHQLGKGSQRRGKRASSSLKKWTPSICAASRRVISRWRFNALTFNWQVTILQTFTKMKSWGRGSKHFPLKHVWKLKSNDHAKEVARTSYSSRGNQHTEFLWLWSNYKE